MLRWFAPLVVGLALVAAGCGGGSSSSETTTTETVTESTTTETTTTGETTSGATTTEAAGNGASGFNWASADCQNLAKAFAGLSAAVGAASGGQDVSGDIEKFSQYADKVPEQARGDVKTLAAAYGTFAKELAKIGYKPGTVPTADQIQQLQKAAEPLGTPEVQKAATHLTAWTKKSCT